MEDLPLRRFAALVPELAVKDLPLGRTLMMMMITIFMKIFWNQFHSLLVNSPIDNNFLKFYLK